MMERDDADRSVECQGVTDSHTVIHAAGIVEAAEI
jgi:hypothetical protein